MSELPPEPPGPPDAPGGEGDASAEDPGQDAEVSNVIVLPGLGGSLPLLDPGDGVGDLSEGLEEGQDPDELGPPEPHLFEGAVEALLLAADGPVQELELERWLGGPGLEAIRDALYTIQDRWRRGHGGIRLVQVAKGWQLRTDVRFAPWVSAMRGGRPVKLSRAALETLSIVAYRQPVTRSEVEELRGVDCGGVLRMLCDRGLAAVTGRKDTPGRPLIYGTTQEFLAMFSLRDLSDLPTLRDLRELQLDDSREQPGAVGQGDEDLDDGEDYDDSYDEDYDELDDETSSDAPPPQRLDAGEPPANSRPANSRPPNSRPPNSPPPDSRPPDKSPANQQISLLPPDPADFPEEPGEE